MKRFLAAILLSVAVVFSAVAKSSRDPLIDFIVNIYNKKEPCTKENFLKHGFIQKLEGKEYVTYWNNLRVTTNSESNVSFEFSNRDDKDFLIDWRALLTYIYDNYDVKEEKGYIFSGSNAEEVQVYFFENVNVYSYAPYRNYFVISYRD